MPGPWKLTVQSFLNAPDVSDATELRLSLLARAASMSLLDQSEAPQMAVVPEFPGQLPPRGPRPSSPMRSSSSRLRKVRGSWTLNFHTCFRSPPSHQVCHRSQSMHWSALAGDCTHMLTATQRRAARASARARTCRLPQHAEPPRSPAAAPLAPLVGTVSQGACTQSSREGAP